MSNKLKMLAGIVIVAAILFFVVGPRLLTRIINNASTPRPLKTGLIKIKASGTLSLAGNHIVLTSPQGLNNYVLVGNKKNELKRLTNKKQTVFVFGELMTPDPKKIDNLTIRYRIDVSQFDTKDFEPAQKLSTQVADSIKRKVAEKSSFRDATLKQLGISDPRMDVISGRLIIIQHLLYANDPKEHYGLMVMDKYGDYYLLYDWGGIQKPYEKYKKFNNMGLSVVVVGHITLPDPSITLPGTINHYIPFSTKKMYNPDLSEFLVEQETNN